MANIRIIKTEEQHLEYLSAVERLIRRQDKLTPAEVENLELLSVIIEAYENRKYPIDPVDPIEAIKFRMHEKGMRQSDLIPIIGTSGRVSEILSRKRPLTVSMIRALSQALGISADVLIGTDQESGSPNEIDWSKFPIKEIASRGWLGSINIKKDDAARFVQEFVLSSGLEFGMANFRRTLFGDAHSPTTTYAIYAYLARVIQTARAQRVGQPKFVEGTITEDFLKELAQLSWFSTGPALAIEFLRKNGISVVIEPQLKGTHLDGAALRDVDGWPIIALTIRYDRLDNFWFTLMHEVAHLWKHVPDDKSAYVDDLSRNSEDVREAEANKIASESFIPRIVWRRSDAYLNPSHASVQKLSHDLRIHPAIIAGRIQRERGDYSILRELLGQNEVRRILEL
jgi:HTH-type transcriptional regulator/antitoxin HigA